MLVKKKKITWTCGGTVVYCGFKTNCQVMTGVLKQTPTSDWTVTVVRVLI